MSDVEAKLDRRRHLVDVLPPGTRGADEPFQNLAFVEEDRLRDADHRFILAHGSLMMKASPGLHRRGEHSAFGQTFGKMALRIKAVNEDGSPLAYRIIIFEVFAQNPISRPPDLLSLHS